jgi:hypothetical protein
MLGGAELGKVVVICDCVIPAQESRSTKLQIIFRGEATIKRTTDMATLSRSGMLGIPDRRVCCG